MTSVPFSWFRAPLDAAIRKVIRPAVAHTRRKMIDIKMSMPLEIFEDFLSPLTPEMVKGLERNEVTGNLVPTKTTAAVDRFEYTISKGSVSDRLFRFEEGDSMMEGQDVCLPVEPHA